MKLDFERSFTKNEYKNLVNAISNRTDYRFNHGKHGDKMVVNIYGSFCDNGIWLPENYYWSISITDCRNGYSGSGNPFRVNELKSYDEIVEFVYNRFNIPKPTNYQASFFD